MNGTKKNVLSKEQIMRCEFSRRSAGWPLKINYKHMKTLCSFLLCILNVCISQGLLGQFKSGEQISIEETYEGDLYVAGGKVTISAPINGDLVTAGGDIFVYDSIQQDLIIAGGNILVEGAIGDDIRCAGGSVDIEGNVENDVLVFGGDVTIDRDAIVSGNLLVFGGKTRVLGDVRGSAKVMAGDVDISGDIGKDLEVTSGQFSLIGNVYGSAFIGSDELFIDPKARIAGNLDYWTDGPLDPMEEIVGGSITFDESLRPKGDGFDWRWGGAVFFILSVGYILAAFLVVLSLHLLFGKQFLAATTSWRTDIAKSFGYGMAYLLGTPILIVILLAIIIGIPIGLFLLSLYIFSLVFGIPIASLLFVNYFNESQDRKWNKGTVVIMALVTVVIIRFVILIPFVGWLIGLVIMAAAFGAFIESWVKARKELAKG